MSLIDGLDFRNKKILVIGEASIDKYIIGSANSISPDAPVPNIKIEQNLNYIGGVGLVIQYIKSLGGIPEVCTIVGNDYDGNFFLKKVKELNIESSGIIIEDNMYTPQITRIRAMNQQILRLETDYSIKISQNVMKKIFNVVETRSSEVESILILNYGIGDLFEDLFIQNLLIKLKRAYKNVPIIARPNSKNYYMYDNVDLIKMNLDKALNAFSIDCCNETSVSIVGKKILNSTKSKNVLLSFLDSESYLITKDTEKILIYKPIIKGPVRSYVSVGSVIMAILSLCYAAKIPVSDGVKIALCGAALSATLPPVEFFNFEKLKNYIQSFSEEL